MKLKDIIHLIGHKSTDPEIVSYFKERNMKIPKWRNANQGEDSVKDKNTGIHYQFKYDITNDRFYPPHSPSGDGYRFEVYLTGFYISFDNKRKGAPTLPADFWEGYLSPEVNREEYFQYFSNQVKPQFPGQPEYGLYGRKDIDDIIQLEVFYSTKENKIATIQVQIREDREFIGHLQFDNPDYFNPQTYLLIIKWLFDQKMLLLPDEVYKEGLRFEDNDIVSFVKRHLRSHLWEGQVKPIENIGHFFYHLAIFAVEYDTYTDEKVDVYCHNLFLKTAGKWDEYCHLDKKGKYEEMDALYLKTRLGQKEKEHFIAQLEDIFQYFLRNYRPRF